MRQPATSPPRMANTYSQVMPNSIRLFVLGDGDLQPREGRGDFDLAGQAGVLAVVRQLAEKIAFVRHGCGQFVGPGRIDVDVAGRAGAHAATDGRDAVV